MKKVVRLLFTIALFSFAFKAQAQKRGDINLALNALYTSWQDVAGVHVGGEYYLNPRTSVAPSFSYLFFDYEGDHYVVNIDFRYYFIKTWLHIYGTLGWSRANIPFDLTFFRRKFVDGINIGIGAKAPLSSRFGVNAQFKYSDPLR